MPGEHGHMTWRLASLQPEIYRLDACSTRHGQIRPGLEMNVPVIRCSRFVAYVSALVLAGCAVKPAIPYDRATAKTIKTIGILTPKFPDHPSAVVASQMAASNRLLTTIIFSSMQSSREERLQRVIAQQGFSVRDSFLASVQAALRDQGYVVTVIPVTRPAPEPPDPSDPRDRPGFLTAYPVDNGKVDACLDLVTADYGYIAADAGRFTPWRPEYKLRARLVSAIDSSVLMENAVVYNPVMYSPLIARYQAVTIAPDPTPEFADFDALAADPATAAHGISTAGEKVAETLGKLLR